MKISIKDLLHIGDQSYRPSIELAKAFVNEETVNESWIFRNLSSILDNYSDQGYTPTFSEIENWAFERAGKFAEEYHHLLQQIRFEAENKNSSLWMAWQSSVDRYSSGEIDKDQHILELAEQLERLDTSAFWSGTAGDKYWHVAKLQSAVIALSRAKIAALDAQFALQGKRAEQLVDGADQLKNDNSASPSLDNHRKPIEGRENSWMIIQDAEEELISYAIKLGFLFRDAWWIEEHGEVTIRGYIAQDTSKKAGEGGSKQASADKLQRMRYLLTAHAELITQNPILLEYPRNEVAFTALKLAIKKNPAAFKRGRSRRIAIEYWEHILAEKALVEEYNALLKTKTYKNDA